MQSYIFDFRKSPSLIQKWNKEFDVEEIDTTCFYLYLLDDICYDNIKQCLDSEGKFIFTNTQMTAHSVNQPCYLKSTHVTDTIDNIILKDDVTFTFGENNFAMKGAFLVTDSGYVMGYSINTYSVNVTNQMIFEAGLEFFEIIEGAYNG